MDGKCKSREEINPIRERTLQKSEVLGTLGAQTNNKYPIHLSQ